MPPTRVIFSTLVFISVVTMARTQVSPIQPPSVCMDGYQDQFEQCDDGNEYNGDGCSIDCLLEDINKWLCVTMEGHTTTCCPLVVHPVTGEKMCSCNETVQPDVLFGFTITPDCEKRDIDECNTNNGNCHQHAICTNYNVVTSPHEIITHECECFPGFVGDGVYNCDKF